MHISQLKQKFLIKISTNLSQVVGNRRICYMVYRLEIVVYVTAVRNNNHEGLKN